MREIIVESHSKVIKSRLSSVITMHYLHLAGAYSNSYTDVLPCKGLTSTSGAV